MRAPVLLGLLLAALVALTAAGPTTSPLKLAQFRGNLTLARTALRRALADPQGAWIAYKDLYGLNLPTAEDAPRLATFTANLQRIIELNNRNDTTWVAGLTQWSHLTFEEFARLKLGALDEDSKPAVNETADVRRGEPTVGGRRALLASPSEHDWRSTNMVSPVRDQGSCGSCWAFAAAGAVESLYRIKRSETLNLSEEQLVDCADVWNLYGNSGCGGGYVSEAMRYMKNNPMAYEARYEYEAGASTNCLESTIDAAVSAKRAAMADSGDAIDDYTKVDKNDYQALIDSVYKNPTAISFRVESSFHHYDSGIYNDASCGTSTNHAMLAVGYSKSGSYWIIKNSWGTSWGESGYARVQMSKSSGSKGVCGMYKSSYRPSL
jgi:hypothetical protein